jgi:hypothetical protein
MSGILDACILEPAQSSPICGRYYNLELFFTEVLVLAVSCLDSICLHLYLGQVFLQQCYR